MPIIAKIIEQHAEEAVFLWLLRDAACNQPHYNLKDLADLDERVEAHLDGLRIAGEEGGAVCEEAWGMEEAGEVFAAALLAFEERDPGRIDAVLEVAATAPELIRGAISALGWLSKPLVEELFPRLLAAENPAVRQIGIGGCAVHRIDPGAALGEALEDDPPGLRARALRAVGELGRVDLLPRLQGDVMATDETCRFSAAWSTGDPAAISWLLERMVVPELARPAGEAFAMITGADLAFEDLEGACPDGFQVGPTEDAQDDNVELDPDEDLPWPDSARLEQWWGSNRQRFPCGARYLAGRPVAEEGLREVLRNGYQRQRAAAALELAILSPRLPLFEVRERGGWQGRRLR